MHCIGKICTFSRDFLKKVLLLALITLLLDPSRVVAQNSAENDLAREIEKRANYALSQHIEMKLFRIYAKVVVSETIEQEKGYFPSGDSQPFSQINLHELAKKASKVTIEVLARKDIAEKSKAFISAVLEKSFQLDFARGDQVLITPMNWISDSPQETTDPRLITEIESIKNRYDLLNQVTGELKLEKNKIMSEFEELKKSQIPSPGKPVDNTSNSGPANINNIMKEKDAKTSLYESMIIALAAIFSALILNFSFRSIGNMVRSGLESFSGVLKQNSTDSVRDSDRNTDSAKSESSTPGSARDSERITQTNFAGIRAELEVYEHALNSLEFDSVVSSIVSHVTVLAEEGNIEVAAATLEFLGEKHASGIYQRLSAKHRKRIVRFIKAGVYTNTRLETVLSAAERLFSTIYGDRFFKVQGGLSSQVAVRLASFDQEMFSALVAEIPTALLSRLMSYVDASFVARTLEVFRYQNKSRFQLIAEALLSPSTNVATSDNQILEFLNKWIPTMSSATNLKEITESYSDIVSMVPEDIRSAIYSHLEKKDPELKNALEDRYITMNTFFSLKDVYLETVMETVAIKDVASVLHSGETVAVERALNMVSELRRNLISDAMTKLESLSTEERLRLYRESAEKIASGIVKLKSHRSIKDIIIQGQEIIPPDFKGEAA